MSTQGKGPCLLPMASLEGSRFSHIVKHLKPKGEMLKLEVLYLRINTKISLKIPTDPSVASLFFSTETSTYFINMRELVPIEQPTQSTRLNAMIIIRPMHKNEYLCSNAV